MSPQDNTDEADVKADDKAAKKIKLTVPPDQTPEEEAALVAAVARSIEESTGDADRIDIELETSEEVSYQAVGSRTGASDRWNR